MPLTEERRSQLDGIVQEMTKNREKDSDIQFVVDDFKSKYEVQQTPNEQHPILSGLSGWAKKGLSSAAAVAEGVGKLAMGDVAGAQEAQTKERSFGIFGTARPVGVNQETGELLSTGQGIKDILATGTEAASWIAPVGAVKAAGAAAKAATGILPRIGAAARAGAPFGALGGGMQAGGAEAAKPTSTVGSVFGETVKGGIGGAIVGTALPVAGGAAKGILSGIGRIAEPAAEAAGKLPRFVAAQASGLSPETIETVERYATKGGFGEATKGLSRETLGEEARSAFVTRFEDLKGIGKDYEKIRTNVSVLPVKVEGGFHDVFRSTLEKDYGLKLASDGTITKTADSVPLSKGDITALEDFARTFASDPSITGNKFLNMREQLSDLSNFGVDRTDKLERLARDLRSKYNEVGKNAFEGLAETDAKYAPERQFVSQIKKDLFKQDGSLKDNALTTLANLTKKGNEAKLARVEELMPGVTEKVKLLRALEDVDVSKGQKIGTYARGAILGFGATGNPIAALLTAILTEPSNFIRIIEAFARAKGVSEGITKGAIKNLLEGKKLNLLERRLVQNAIVDLSKRGSRSVASTLSTSESQQ